VKLGRIVTAAGVAAGLLIAVPTPASAHDILIFHGEDRGLIDNHEAATAEDRECDGNIVVTEYYYTTIGGQIYGEVADTNGCDNGEVRRSTAPQRIARARVCERGLGPTAGCTSWRNIT
jgi:hypothetical protein